MRTIAYIMLIVLGTTACYSPSRERSEQNKRVNNSPTVLVEYSNILAVSFDDGEGKNTVMTAVLIYNGDTVSITTSNYKNAWSVTEHRLDSAGREHDLQIGYLFKQIELKQLYHQGDQL